MVRRTGVRAKIGSDSGVSLLTTRPGHFSTHFAQGVARNSNLNRAGRELGLDRFINHGNTVGDRIVADTVEAILGATYLESGKDKAKDVMDSLGLLPRERLLERQLKAEGLVMLNSEDVAKLEGNGRKRRKSDA